MLEWLKKKFKKEELSNKEAVDNNQNFPQEQELPTKEEKMESDLNNLSEEKIEKQVEQEERIVTVLTPTVAEEKVKEENSLKTEDLKAEEGPALEAETFVPGDSKIKESETEHPSDEKPAKLSFFQKIVKGLTKTRDNLSGKIDDVLFSFKKIDESMFEELEEILITADVGVETTLLLIDNLRERIKKEKTTDPQEVKSLLKDEILCLMNQSVQSNSLRLEPFPAIVLVVGVNGVGKTTTIGKLSARLKSEGKNVLICAADTFRAAAIEQLEEWGRRSGVNVISHTEGSDPAAVVFDAINAAKARNVDVLICDTAGRLHNKSNLMNELNKIFRVSEREFPQATREVLLVLDATTGQNAMNQAKTFKEVANITGIALTKLDGTAKGGVIIALENELNIPVKLVGVGEGIDDLQPFENKSFVEAIFQ